MKFHKVADIFPLMQGKEFEELKADILANGVRERIWTHEGQIVDGRNRWRACKELGVECPSQGWDGKGSLVAFVVSLNLHRRHLTESQRAAAAADAEPMFAREAAKRKQETEGRPKKSNGKPVAIVPPVTEPKAKARDEAAAAFNVGSRYVQDAKKVKKDAPDLHEKVKAGEITIPQAKREVVRREKREELEAKAAAVPTPTKDSPTWEIILGDCTEHLPKLSGVRLVFADPPYNIGIDYGNGKKADRLSDEEYLRWCRQWINSATNALASDGSFWLMAPDEYAEHFAIMLAEAGLHRRAWIKWYETFGNNCANNFNRCSRHIFYCVANPKRLVFNRDAVVRPSDRQAKYSDSRADPGGKIWDDVWNIPRLVDNAKERIPDFPTQLPLEMLRAIVGCASDPGDLVCDPFNGSGTTGVAAIELKRRYVGIEKQENFHGLAKKRLQAAAAGGS